MNKQRNNQVQGLLQLKGLQIHQLQNLQHKIQLSNRIHLHLHRDLVLAVRRNQNPVEVLLVKKKDFSPIQTIAENSTDALILVVIILNLILTVVLEQPGIKIC